MADAPLACSGDGPRDGVGNTSSRVVANTADRFRNLADWLDAHPGAVVDVLTKYAEPWIVSSYGCGSPEEMHDAARALDPGQWVFKAEEKSFVLGREILPGLRFEFFLSRAKAQDVAEEKAA